MRKRRRGFTLIELLVVIAIIAILAAILFPVFLSARDAARKAACLSYLAELGKAQLLYRDSYDDRMPLHFAGIPGGGLGSYATYYFLLAKYTRTRNGSFLCPSALRNGTVAGPGAYGCTAYGIENIPGTTSAEKAAFMGEHFGYHYTNKYTATSYAADWYPLCAENPNKSTWVAFAASSRWRRQSWKAYLWEATKDFVYGADEIYLPADKGGSRAPRHAGGTLTGILFYDGHAEMKNNDWITKNGNALINGGW